MKKILYVLIIALMFGCSDDDLNCNGLGYANLNNFSSITQEFIIGSNNVELSAGESRQIAISSGVYTVRVYDGFGFASFPVTSIGECQEKDFTVTD